MDRFRIIELTQQYPMTQDYEFSDSDLIFEVDGYLIICEDYTNNIITCSYGEHSNSIKDDIQLIWNKLIEYKKQFIRIHPASKWRVVFKMFPDFNDYCVDGEYMYLKLYGDDNE